MHRPNSVLAVKTGPKTKNILLDAGPKSGALGIWGPCAVAQPAQASGRPCVVCPHTPCLCPEPGYGFLGLSPVLHGHLAERHQWPVTDIAYGSMLDWSWRYRCKVWVHTPVDADTDHIDVLMLDAKGEELHRPRHGGGHGRGRQDRYLPVLSDMPP